MKVILVKLGGSLITEKTGVEAARLEVIERLAGELAQFLTAAPPDLRVVLGHGSGSYGHAAARGSELRAGVGAEPATDEVALRLAGSTTQAAAARLHRLLADRLVAAGVPAFTITPGSAGVADDGNLQWLAEEALTLALRLGLVPVVHGDVVTDRHRGLSICSTESVFESLVPVLRRLDVELLGALWLGETAGLLSASGATVEQLEPETAASHVGETRGTDVTGGMAHRLATVRRLADRGVDSMLLDGAVPGNLQWALARVATADWETDARCSILRAIG